jgi:hypothetical protein
MGMSGCFAPVTAAQLEALRRDPDSIEAFLYPDDGESEAEGVIDVDKAWQGLHDLLTGTADQGERPRSLAIFGGEEFGPEIGIGPVRFLTPAQVRDVSAALADFSEAELRANFNPRDMAAQKIYPDIIWVRDGEEALDYLLENFEPLAEFYAAAAASGDSVLQWIA